MVSLQYGRTRRKDVILFMHKLDFHAPCIVRRWLVPMALALVLSQVLTASGQAAFWARESSQAGAWQVVDERSFDADGGMKPVISPDGRWIAGIVGLEARQICVWRISSGEQRCNEESARVAEASIAWSPDSRQVAFSQNGNELDSDVFVLDVRSNSLTNYTDDEVDDLKAARTASAFVIYDKWPVWSADGAEIFFLRILNPRDEQGQRQISVSRIVMDTGQIVRGPELYTDEPLAYVAETVGAVLPPVRTPDGRMYFSLRGGRDISGIYVIDPDEQSLTLIESDPAIRPSNVPLITGSTADGSLLSMYWLWNDVSIGDARYAYTWYDRDSEEIVAIDLQVPSRMAVAAPPRLSPDGTAVVYGLTEDPANRDSTVVVQDLASGEVVEIATGVNLQFWESVTGLTWTDDNQIAIPMDTGDFTILTLERG